MEVGDPRFPEYPGWGPRDSQVLPPRTPPPPVPRVFFSAPAARSHRTERRPERPGGPSVLPPRPHSWRPNFLARVSHSAPCQCALGKGQPELPRRRGRGLGGLCGVPGSEREARRAPPGQWVPRPLGAGTGAGAGRAHWRIPGTHAAHAFLPTAPRDAVAATVRRPPSSCSRPRADPRWLRAPWSPTASFPPPG